MKNTRQRTPVNDNRAALPKKQIRHFDPAKRDPLAGDVEDPACPGLPWDAPWAEKPCVFFLDDEFLGDATTERL
jgi:hypothetical protein